VSDSSLFLKVRRVAVRSPRTRDTNHRRKDAMNRINLPLPKTKPKSKFFAGPWRFATIAVTLGVPAVYLRMAFPPLLSD